MISIIIVTALTGAVIYILKDVEEKTEVKKIPLPRVEKKMVVGSIAFDGEFLWTTRIPTTVLGEGRREIVKSDTTGKEIFRTVPEVDICDIAFDGKNVWTADIFGSEDSDGADSKFYIVDEKSGELYDQFSNNENYTIEAMTGGNRTLWVFIKIVTADLEREQYLYEINTRSGDIVSKILVSDNSLLTCSGMAYSDDFLWMIVLLDRHTLFRIDPETGVPEEKFDYEEKTIIGITTIDGEIYLLDKGENVLFLHRE
jgi:hypothetical protein